MTKLRVATYNIHKGVQGLGPRQRLEIHNLGHAVEQLDADVICLQEVRKMHRGHARRFTHWPDMEQADFLAPLGYEAVYRTNAVTRHGEHGNALLSRWPVVTHQHEDMSDHRFEQRGLLHVEVKVDGTLIHVVVVHLGLIRASRVRQVIQLLQFIKREIPADAPLLVAGDFNDWGSHVQTTLAQEGLVAYANHRTPTFPSRLPLVQLDYVFARGLKPTAAEVPRGRIWWRMSDHLPLIADFELTATGRANGQKNSMPQIQSGHAVQLLQGGEAFFGSLIQALDASQVEVRMETYIFNDDVSGQQVAAALARAALRGVQVYLVVDGAGTPVLSNALAEKLTGAGVQWRIFSPLVGLGWLFPSRWRRLHRKLCVVDGLVGFCGGINVLDDYMDPNHGVLKAPRFDFSVRVQGPLVQDMHHAVVQFWLRQKAAINVKRRGKGMRERQIKGLCFDFYTAIVIRN